MPLPSHGPDVMVSPQVNNIVLLLFFDILPMNGIKDKGNVHAIAASCVTREAMSRIARKIKI